MKTKTEIFNWTEILAAFGLAGMNIFQIIQGMTGAIIGVMAILYGYWRIRATKAKALHYENGDKNV